MLVEPTQTCSADVHAVTATLVNRWFSLSLLDSSNAAPEWQAGCFGWRSRELMAVCLLEGCVREWQECQAQGEVTLSK